MTNSMKSGCLGWQPDECKERSTSSTYVPQDDTDFIIYQYEHNNQLSHSYDFQNSNRKTNRQLQKENTSLKRNLQTVQNQLYQSERKMKEAETENQSLKTELDMLKQCMLEAQQLQKKTIDQYVNIINELQNTKKLIADDKDMLYGQLKQLKSQRQNIHSYRRQEILSYHSKNKQMIKPRDDIGREQQALENVFIQYDKNISNWMSFTQKMSQQYNVCKVDLKNKQNVKEMNPAVLLSPYIKCKLCWEHQQNQMELIADILRQLGEQKRLLQDSVNTHDKKVSHQNKIFQEELKKYTKTNKHRIKLENEMRIKLKELNECCDAENKLNKRQCKFFEEYNTLDIELYEYQKILKHYNTLMNKYRKFDSVNDNAINEMQTYFDKQWIESMKTWYTWTAKSIICFIRYLREIGILVLSGNVDLSKILKQMKINKVDGHSLLNIDKNDLKSIGFEVLNDRQRVFNQIQQLVSTYPTIYDDEGKQSFTPIKVPNEFKCPLSGKIMEHPVVIFDSMTYEKSEIVKYLKEYKQSPKTKRKCDADDIWFLPDRKLKQKIEAFLSVNQQYRNQYAI